jgi:cytochrome c biogenesis protein CcdA
VDPFSLLEAGRWLGVPAALVSGVLLGASPFAWPVMAAVVGGQAAVTRPEGPRRGGGVVAGATAALVVVYGALGAVAGSIDHVVRGVLGPRTGAASAALAGLLLIVGVVLMVRPAAACRLRSTAATSTSGWLLGIPLALVNCPACAGIITGIAVSAAASGSSTYTVVVMATLGLGHGLALLFVAWLTTARWRPTPAQQLAVQRVGAAVLLAVGAYYAWQATVLGPAVAPGPTLP